MLPLRRFFCLNLSAYTHWKVKPAKRFCHPMLSVDKVTPQGEKKGSSPTLSISWNLRERRGRCVGELGTSKTSSFTETNNGGLLPALFQTQLNFAPFCTLYTIPHSSLSTGKGLIGKFHYNAHCLLINCHVLIALGNIMRCGSSFII